MDETDDILGLDKVFGKLELPTLDLPEFDFGLEPKEEPKQEQDEKPVTEEE